MPKQKPNGAFQPINLGVVFFHLARLAMANETADYSLPCKHVTVVDESEAGQKILQLLQRRLSLPQNLLHRWIRSGQVRINGCRCTPFARVEAGDKLRLPPFADKCRSATSLQAKKPTVKKEQQSMSIMPVADIIGQSARLKKLCKSDLANPSGSLELVDEYRDIMAFHKPAGLAVHPGTGQSDSFVTRLHVYFAGSRFMPTPAHRLDRDTSGILLVARTYQALHGLHSLFSTHDIVKEYFAWVNGAWPNDDTVMLRDFLARRLVNGKEKICVVNADQAGTGTRPAICLAKKIANNGQHSLLQIRLLTGQKHQIRVQLAAAGYPIIGDRKYGKNLLSDMDAKQKRLKRIMYLHAFRIVLPDGHVFACLPGWTGDHSVKVLPEIIAYQEKQE